VATPAMARGAASGVGSIALMYGTIFVGFFAALLSGASSQLSAANDVHKKVKTITIAPFLAAALRQKSVYRLQTA
jgi:SulP family sulfate permease